MVSSDEQLIERCLGGETEAFNGLVRKWEKRMFNFALRYCGSREDAKDLSQEIFTSAFQRLGGLRDRTRFAPWLYKIALNHCRMRLRAGKHRQHVSLDGPEPNGALNIEVSHPAAQGPENPEEVAGRNERQRLLREALSGIAEEQRLVILLKEYEGLKFHEIAEVLECPLSTIKSRLYLGFRSLRKSLEEKGMTS